MKNQSLIFLSALFACNTQSVSISDDIKTAWFEEISDTWTGNCRGSGILVFKENNWKIKHYNLAVAVPNNIIKKYVKLLKKK